MSAADGDVKRDTFATTYGRSRCDKCNMTDTPCPRCHSGFVKLRDGVWVRPGANITVAP